MLNQFTSKYPYTDYHELNLDWLLNAMGQLRIDFDTFVNINEIKYADPLLWSISRQYEKNTLVQDDSGNTFLSKKPVPIGISLENSEYWLQVADFDATANQIRRYIAVNEGTTTTALTDHQYGDLVWISNALYRIISDIEAGTAYIEGTNIEEITVADAFSIYYDEAGEALQFHNKFKVISEPVPGDVHTYDPDIEAIIIQEG